MKRILLLSFTLILLINLNSSFSQETPNPNTTLKIGIKITPPFIIENNGEYSGLSIKSWEMVNEKLGKDYEYIVFNTLEELLSAVEKGEVDFSINPVTVTVDRMKNMGFSQPYFISETSVAKKQKSGFVYFIKNIFSWNFLKAIVILLSVIFLFGFLVWIFERKKNEEEFGGKFKGLAQGFWWSAVTMTTVGYGDKSPRTTGGRVVGFIWMFAAIIMISSLTAGIASSLTAQSLQGDIRNIQDLKNTSVVTLNGSSSADLLNQYSIKYIKTDKLEEALQMVADDKVDVIVYDRPLLTYQIEEAALTNSIAITETSFKKDYYSYSFPLNSPLKETINANLISILKTTEWNMAIENY